MCLNYTPIKYLVTLWKIIELYTHHMPTYLEIHIIYVSQTVSVNVMCGSGRKELTLVLVCYIGITKCALMQCNSNR